MTEAQNTSAPADESVEEPLADREPVELVEVDEPSARPPAGHGDWVDAQPTDPGLDHTGCAEKYLGGDGEGAA